MPTWLIENMDKIPFVTAAAPAGVRISTQRMMEAAIIGVVLAGIGYVAVIPRLEERISLEMAHVRADIQRINGELMELRKADMEALQNEKASALEKAARPR